MTSREAAVVLAQTKPRLNIADMFHAFDDCKKWPLPNEPEITPIPLSETEELHYCVIHKQTRAWRSR